MGIINSNKSIGNVTAIDCDGILNVTIGIVATPDIVNTPTDIVLVLDRSLSMQGQPLADLKTGVNTFIDIIASATGGSSGMIGSGSHIGIVSFASTAVQDTALITSVDDLKAAVAALTAGGSTNHGDAFTEATALLSGSTNSKVIVMFTDGLTTTGPAPSPIAAAARAQGIVIYCIGLVGTTGIDVNTLNDWATDPDVTHVAVAPDSSQLDQIFADLAANISVPGATDIVINEVVNPDFAIVNQPFATVGTVSQITANSFRWTIDQLGVTATESGTVSFSIQHVTVGGGIKPVDQSLSYTDNEGNLVSFAEPSVYVDCVPEMSITKSADKTSVCTEKEDIKYTLVVSNPGKVPLTDVTIYDSIPQGLYYKPGTTRKDDGLPTDANPQSGIYIGSLNPDESSTVTFELKICAGSCGGVSLPEFVNTAWAKGTANQVEAVALSEPWIVSFNGRRIIQYAEKAFKICDFTCYQHGHVYPTGTTPFGGAVKAGYRIAIKYTDRCGKTKNTCLEGSVIFSNLPGDFDYSSSDVRFDNLTCLPDRCGNVHFRFEAALSYCNKT